MGQELDEAETFSVQLPSLHENCATFPQQMTVEPWQSEARRGQQNNDALRVAGRLGPAFLHGFKDGRQGHGMVGM
jgi:hypothetical protein